MTLMLLHWGGLLTGSGLRLSCRIHSHPQWHGCLANKPQLCLAFAARRCLLSHPQDTALLTHRLPSCSHRSHSCKCIISQILSDRILYSGPGFLGLHCLSVCGTRVAPRPDITMLPTSNVMITDSFQPKVRTKEVMQVASQLPPSLT